MQREQDDTFIGNPRGIDYRLKTIPVVFMLQDACAALQTRCKSTAIPCPPPMQAEPIAYLTRHHKNDENTPQAPAYFLPVLWSS